MTVLSFNGNSFIWKDALYIEMIQRMGFTDLVCCSSYILCCSELSFFIIHSSDVRLVPWDLKSLANCRLFNSLFRLATKKTSKLCITAHCGWVVVMMMGGGGASVDFPLKGPVMLNSTSVMTSTYMWSENDFCLLMLGLHQTPEGLEIYSP